MKKLEKLKFIAEVELAKKFINECTGPTLNIQSTSRVYRTSYGYKHDAERYFNTYISNDAFIKAADDLGVRSKPTDSGKNRFFAMKLNEKKYQFEIESNKWQGTFASAFDRLQFINNKNL
jgi:hypothetical protein